MTESTCVLVSSLLLLLVTSACSKTTSNPPTASQPSPVVAPSPQKVTSESVVKAAAQPVDLAAGGSAEAIVRVTIQSGYHINANPPSYPYLKATALEISPADGISVGFVSYPKALDKKFPFAEKPLAIYEGETSLKATLKAEPAAKKGERSIPAHLRIQACDDQVCYPPGTLTLAIPVNIK